MANAKDNRTRAEPVASRPAMPEYDLLAPDEGRGLLPWTWAEERLFATLRYWLATTRPNGHPHVTAVWGVWVDTVFYFSTGCQSRKARNLAQQMHCVVSTESAAEAVIVEGIATLVTNPQRLAQIAAAYQQKYIMAYPENSCVYSVEPAVAFGFIEDATEFAGSATRWQWQ